MDDIPSVTGLLILGGVTTTLFLSLMVYLFINRGKGYDID